jgi:hydrogenase nickel incorporation protein HypA/HybF
MHELGIARNIVAIVVEAARGKHVRCVRLELGRLGGVMPDAIAFCFDVVAQGTVLEGAKLEIDVVPGVARCRSCGAEFGIDVLFAVCGCGSRELAVIRGEELMIKNMEVEEAELSAQPVDAGEGQRRGW